MSFDPSKFAPAGMRLGVADQLNDTYVAPQAAAAGDPVDPAYRAKATQAAVKFESFFIGHMLHQMREGASALAADDSPGKNAIDKDMLDMADNLVADRLASQRSFGVANMILRQLLPQAPSRPPVAAADVAQSQNLQATLNSSK